MTTHELIGMSDLYRTFECSGSVYMKTKFPAKESSEYAKEGTTFHAAVEATFNDYLFNGFSLDEALKIHQDKCTDDEMRGHVEKACREMKAQLEGVGADKIARIALEEKFMLSDDPRIGGTGDLAYLVRVGTEVVLVLWDLKYGANVGVEVEGNLQLMGYACAANATKGWGPVSRAVVFIYQPRFPHPEGPLRRLKISGEELRDWTKSIIEVGKKVKKELEAGAPTFNPGEHCHWCIADGRCEAQVKAFQKTAEIDFLPTKKEEKPKLPIIGTLSMAQKEVLVLNRKAMENFLSAVEGAVLQEMQDGVEYPNLKLVRGKTNRGWRGTTDEIIKVLTEAGVKDPAVVTPCSFAVVTKDLGKKKAEEIFAEWTVKPEGPVKVVSLSDRRPAINQEALDDFTMEENENS